MAIRLNLLAEAQAVEDMRRRDPVKRSIFLGAALVVMMLFWSSSLQVKAMMGKLVLSRTEKKMSAFTNDYKHVVENQRKWDEAQHKIEALNQLTAQRFLHATALNALQHATVDDVQLIRYRADQLYTATEAVKPRTNDNRVIPGKRGTATEKVVIVLEGSDSSRNPGDQVTRFKELVSSVSFFPDAGKSNVFSLKSISQPQLLPVPGTSVGKSAVVFTMEAKLLEKTR